MRSYVLKNSNVFSYKRLVENFWAPVTISYGFDTRTTAIRVITPPTCDTSASRIEVRIPGADVNPYLALSALIGCGIYGIQNSLSLDIDPIQDNMSSAHLSKLTKNLRDATQIMMESNSIARQVLGDAFVDHYGKTRLHECDEWDQAVTDWEIKRYMESI